MKNRIDIEALEARNLPRATSAILNIENKAVTDDEKEKTAAVIRRLDEYLSDFLPPSGKCVNCDSALGGLLGSFTWGIVHGEGFCALCGYPGAAHHFIKDSDGSDLLTIRNMILQYHPQALTRAEEV